MVWKDSECTRHITQTILIHYTHTTRHLKQQVPRKPVIRVFPSSLKTNSYRAEGLFKLLRQSSSSCSSAPPSPPSLSGPSSADDGPSPSHSKNDKRGGCFTRGTSATKQEEENEMRPKTVSVPFSLLCSSWFRKSCFLQHTYLMHTTHTPTARARPPTFDSVNRQDRGMDQDSGRGHSQHFGRRASYLGRHCLSLC